MQRREFVWHLASSAIAGLGLSACKKGSAASETHAAPSSSQPLKGSSRVVLANVPGPNPEGCDSQKLISLLRKIQQNLKSQASDLDFVQRLSNSDVVGIKLNCIAGQPLSPKPALVAALSEWLQELGVPASQIIFFDRSEADLSKAGFTPKASGPGPRFLGNDSEGCGFEEEVTTSGEVGSCLSKILTQRITKLINVGVLKDHNLAGVSGAMKNLYGVLHNPNKYHDNNCDPYIADVWQFPVVQKTHLFSLVDATLAQAHGGPAFSAAHAWPLGKLMLSTDPVALDRVGWDLLERQRALMGLPTLEAQNRKPKFLETAQARGLGHTEPQAIDVVEI